jgi:hypothetical protein
MGYKCPMPSSCDTLGGSSKQRPAALRNSPASTRLTEGGETLAGEPEWCISRFHSYVTREAIKLQECDAELLKRRERRKEGL